MPQPDITKEEFVARFVSYMPKYVGHSTFNDGSTVTEYAQSVVETYYQEYLLDNELAPEELAEAEIDYMNGEK